MPRVRNPMHERYKALVAQQTSAGEVVALKAQAQAKPEPEPEPEPEGPEPKKAGKAEATGVVLKPDAPYDSASVYVQRHCLRDGVLALHYWRKGWWRWDGQCYRGVSEEEMKHRSWEFLADAMRTSGFGLVPFKPLPTHVSGLLEA